jgi:5'-3' exonuclease
MHALIDADILRYEVGFASEVGWKATTERDEVPPFDYVKELLDQRIASILSTTEATDFTLFLTEGQTFRYDLAKRTPYKANRKEAKPWHHKNLSAYMKGVYNAQVVTYIEADDAIAIEHTKSPDTTIICSRDKDLRQVPGHFYSWELGRQPSFGPLHIANPGTLELSNDRRSLKGTGYAFFCGQLLVGDRVDSIPGLNKYGPVLAYNLLHPIVEKGCYALIDKVMDLYQEAYPDTWEEELLEQGRLLWLIRDVKDNGDLKLWELGMVS